MGTEEQRNSTLLIVHARTYGCDILKTAVPLFFCSSVPVCQRATYFLNYIRTPVRAQEVYKSAGTPARWHTKCMLYFPYSFPIPLSKVYRRDTEQMPSHVCTIVGRGTYTKGIQIIGA